MLVDMLIVKLMLGRVAYELDSITVNMYILRKVKVLKDVNIAI